jgi:hypothetical protein
MMQIYKTVFDTEQQGKDILISKGVWEEVTEEGVTSMQFTNGTAAVVNIGKVVEIPATYDADGNELTPPVYFPGWAYDVMSSDLLDFGTYEVFPAPNEVHSFMGWAKDSEVPPTLEPEIKKKEE